MQMEYVLFAAPVLLLIFIYNSLVSKRNEVEHAIGGVHAYLKKRADLIPNIVATVKQYASHESKLLSELTEIRASINSTMEKGDLVGADSQMSSLFGRVIAVAESYPDLKASQNFLGLQSSLNEVEGQLSAARRTYNAAVIRFNTAIESFPGVVVANLMGLKRKAVFTVTDEDAKRPDVDQLFGKSA